jgi:hypothetical protein
MNIGGESIPWDIIGIVAASLAVSGLAIFLAMRYVRRIGTYTGDPTKMESASAFIASVRQTNLYVNNQPQMEFTLIVFPPNGPMKQANTKRVVSFVELPVFQPGTYVDVTYERDTFKHLNIEGPKAFAVTGEPFDMDYFENITKSLPENEAVQASGTILSRTETGSFVDRLPVYRFRVSYETAEGKKMEGVTMRVCRPWMAAEFVPDRVVKVVYNRNRPEVFSIVE